MTRLADLPIRTIRAPDRPTKPLPKMLITPSVRRVHRPRNAKLTDKQIRSAEHMQLFLEFMRLQSKPISGTELREIYGGSRSTIIKYLRILLDRSLIARTDRFGRDYYYSATDSTENML